MATIQELIPGTLVICSTRMPYHVQPWIHGFHIGTIQEPGTVPTEWNGYNSEKYYCELTGTIPVKYEFGVQHEDRKSTRLNSSHQIISYAVFCLQKKQAVTTY